jgi:hypothetical protein
METMKAFLQVETIYRHGVPVPVRSLFFPMVPWNKNDGVVGMMCYDGGGGHCEASDGYVLDNKHTFIAEEQMTDEDRQFVKDYAHSCTEVNDKNEWKHYTVKVINPKFIEQEHLSLYHSLRVSEYEILYGSV